MQEHFVIFDDKTDQQKPQLFTIHCKSEQLIDAFINKTQTKPSILELVCIHVCLHANGCNTPTITISNYPLFVEYNNSKPLTSAIQSFDKIHKIYDKVIENAHRIEYVLTDLRNQLLSQNDEYLKPIQNKVNHLHNILSIVENINKGIEISGDVAAKNVRISNMGNAMNTIVLNNNNFTRSKNISTLYTEMKAMIETAHIRDDIRDRSKIKRSVVAAKNWAGQFIHVNRLYLRGTHPFESAYNIFGHILQSILCKLCKAIILFLFRCHKEIKCSTQFEWKN